jgi:formylglycine-generating enzyme required for sulfatase activity
MTTWTIEGLSDGHMTTAPVMSFKPNDLGIYDLGGNLQEACELAIPVPNEGPVVRGGSWFDGLPSDLVSSRRVFVSARDRSASYGFRVVLELSPAASAANPPAAPVPLGPAVKAPTVTPATDRQLWTNSAGRQIEGEFVRIEEQELVLKVNGKEVRTPLATLSSESQQAAARMEQARAKAPPGSTTAVPAAPALVAASSVAPGYLLKATKDKPFTNSLGMKFVPVPVTKVLFCIHETRRKDYAAFAEKQTNVGTQWMEAKGENSHAVVNVNWDDAQAFCAWLTQKDGVKHRLPTDREWSFAVGIGHLEQEEVSPKSLSEQNNVHYPWGTSWPPPNQFGNYMEGGINRGPPASATEQYSDGYNGISAPVMSYKPNAIGIHDLGGNVWEWCADWYDETQTTMVMRGGSWWAGFTPEMSN